jgi:hypothetical protein
MASFSIFLGKLMADASVNCEVTLMSDVWVLTLCSAKSLVLHSLYLGKKKTSGDETEQVFMIGSEVIDQARTRRSRRAGCRWLELKPELIDKQYT